MTTSSTCYNSTPARCYLPRTLLLSAWLLLSTSVTGFVLPSQRRMHRSVDLQQLFADAPKGPAGSFFNPVPEDSGKDGDDDDNDDIETIEDEIFQVLRSRKRSQASKPSTINGVPTSKASGFGVKKETPTPKKETTSQKPYIPIGPPDNKRFNDPTKPEYDDQGYTLYADEKTGEKSRMFEALVDYPCNFTMKIVGANEGAFVTEIVALVAEACTTEAEEINYTTRVMGKWTSVTVQAPVESAEMLYSLYEAVDRDPRVKFKF